MYKPRPSCLTCKNWGKNGYCPIRLKHTSMRSSCDDWDYNLGLPDHK